MIPWERLLIIPQRRIKPRFYPDRKVIGLDTETRDGKVILIADSLNRYLEVTNPWELFDFLTFGDYRSSLLFLYNLRYDFQAILKWLPWQVCVQLWEEGKSIWEDYAIRYIPKKFFSIAKGHKSYSFYDIAQFFIPYSLDYASRKWLGKHKLLTDVKDITEITEELIAYCKKDAFLTAELGELLKRKMLEFGISPKHWYSRASLSEFYFRRNCYIPRVEELPREISEYAYKSYHGGWCETFKRGSFQSTIYYYDIISAYPAEIANLIDFTKGKWLKSPDLLEDAYWGFIKAKIDVRYCYASPLIYRTPKELNFNPCGEFTGYFTLDEIKYALKQRWKVTPISGWYFYPDILYYPFRDKIMELYLMRAKVDELTEYSIKTILCSLYGKFIQKSLREKRYYKTGNLFLPIYASIITANVRLKIAEVVGEKSLIAIATDGILNLRKIPSLSSGLGGWKVKYTGKEVVVLGNGLYSIKLDDDRIISTNRGFLTQREAGENNWYFQLLKNPAGNSVCLSSERPVTIGDVISKTLIYKPDDLNIFLPDNKELSINFDYKRIWRGDFLNNEDVLNRIIDSSIVDMSVIT